MQENHVLQTRAALFLLLFFGILWAVVFAGSTSNSCWLYSAALSEQSLAELSTLVFYWFAMIAFYRLYKDGNRWFYLPGFFGSFFVMMEEINWGQTLLTRTDLQPITFEFSLHESTEIFETYMLFSVAEVVVYVLLPVYLLSRAGLSRPILALAALLPPALRLVLLGAPLASCGLESSEEVREMLLACSVLYLPMLELILEYPKRQLKTLK